MQKKDTYLDKKIELFTGKRGGKWLGIAPFSHFSSKDYPISKLEQVVRKIINNHKDIKIFIFGVKTTTAAEKNQEHNKYRQG